jgi:hypothetical protein
VQLATAYAGYRAGSRQGAGGGAQPQFCTAYEAPGAAWG